MPVIRPFRGLRFNPAVVGDLSEVVAPPYDIIYDEWREKLYERNPKNIVRLIKTKEEPDDTEEHNKYSRAREYIDSWMNDGVLKLEDKPVIYVRSDTYKINGETRTRYGFIALIKIEDFGKGIHPHERTLSAPKVDRMNLVKATGTNLSQIFSIYKDQNGEIEKILLSVAKALPDVDFADEQGIIRKMWVVDDAEIITRLQNIMKNREIIIADGHHRYETAIAYKEHMESKRTSSDEPFDYVSMYFSNINGQGMTILPAHRKVGGLETFDEDSFFTELSGEFNICYHGDVKLQDVLNLIKQDSDHINIFGIYTSGRLSVARYKYHSDPKELDVEILHEIIIEKILGISREDITKGKYLHFCKSPEHAYDDVANGKDQVSFFLNAVTPQELFREVLKGRIMPQKSTYFYPKTLSGLVMYKIDRESLG